jgi:hypothetical protein
MDQRKMEKVVKSFISEYDETHQAMVIDILDPDTMFPLIIRVPDRPSIKQKTIILTKGEKIHMQ